MRVKGARVLPSQGIVLSEVARRLARCQLFDGTRFSDKESSYGLELILSQSLYPPTASVLRKSSPFSKPRVRVSLAALGFALRRGGPS